MVEQWRDRTRDLQLQGWTLWRHRQVVHEIREIALERHVAELVGLDARLVEDADVDLREVTAKEIKVRHLGHDAETLGGVDIARIGSVEQLLHGLLAALVRAHGGRREAR